jgi:hypothetical protein
MSSLERAPTDVQEIVKRTIKYLVEGGATAVACYLVAKNRLNVEEILLIALTAAAVFAILDMFSPSISYAARQGAGFGLGANMVGFPNLGMAAASPLV